MLRHVNGPCRCNPCCPGDHDVLTEKTHPFVVADGTERDVGSTALSYPPMGGNAVGQVLRRQASRRMG